MSKSKYAILAKTLVNLAALQTSATARIKALSLLTYFAKTEHPRPTSTDEKFDKYWPPSKTLEEILVEADDLYEDKKYIEVYELLNRLKYHNNSDVKWRIARVLYQTTATNVLPLEMEKDIIAEAYNLLVEEASEDNTNPNIHKWFAIVCDCLTRLHGLEKRILGYHVVLKHLRIAYKLDPDDITVCYLLGKLCFDMADIQGFKRFVAKTLYAEPPECTFEEAYKYLSRVDQLSKKKYLTNSYLLGSTCYKLKQYYKAKHYLSWACCMTPESDCERRFVCRAKQLLAKLEKYTLGKQVLFPDCNCPGKEQYRKDDNSNVQPENNAKSEMIIDSEEKLNTEQSSDDNAT